MSSGKLRGAVQSTVATSFGSATGNAFQSKVVAPRNPKLVRDKPQDDKVTWLLFIILSRVETKNGSYHHVISAEKDSRQR